MGGNDSLFRNYSKIKKHSSPKIDSINMYAKPVKVLIDPNESISSKIHKFDMSEETSQLTPDVAVEHNVVQSLEKPKLKLPKIKKSRS